MGVLLDVVADHLTAMDWNFDRDEEANAIASGVKAKNANFRLFFFVDEETQIVLLHIVPSNLVPEERRLAAADYITRANFGLRIGNFELDLNDGQVLYKVSIDIEGGILVPTMVKNMLDAGISTSDRYFPGLMSVCYAVQDPVEAIKSVEDTKTE